MDIVPADPPVASAGSPPLWKDRHVLDMCDIAAFAIGLSTGIPTLENAAIGLWAAYPSRIDEMDGQTGHEDCRRLRVLIGEERLSPSCAHVSSAGIGISHQGHREEARASRPPWSRRSTAGHGANRAASKSSDDGNKYGPTMHVELGRAGTASQ